VPALTDDDFDREVIGAQGTVLVDFWAPWCTPCKKLSPVVEALAGENAGTLKVVALDVEAHPAAAARHDVLSLPTLIVFQGGQEARRITGAPSEKKLRKALADFLA
jgi:thioredoxin 1